MSLRSFILNHPAPLCWSWRGFSVVLKACAGAIEKLGADRASRWVGIVEHPFKAALFSCTRCGQCVLHSTGMTCPMTCPKKLRNGPCGGVCRDGKCEADPEKDCVWVLAVERAARTGFRDDIHDLLAAPDWRREGSSSWTAHALGQEPTFLGSEIGYSSALQVLESRPVD